MARNRTFRALLKSALVFAASKKPAQAIARQINREKIIFLAYHGVVPDKEPMDAWTLVRESAFRMQMEYIKANFDCLSIEQALFQERRGSARPGVVVTFDDGYANNLKIALPILAEFGIPAIIYVSTRFVLERELFWPDKIWMAAKYSGLSKIDLRDIGPRFGEYRFNAQGNEWRQAILKIVEEAKKVRPSERKRVVEAIVKKFKYSEGAREFEIEVENNAFTPLKVAQIEKLSLNPSILIGAHSHCHSLLDEIPLSEARESMLRSKKVLDWVTNSESLHFAYPNGNYNESLIQSAKDLGFISAVGYRRGFFHKSQDVYTIRRLGISAETSGDLFKAMLTGLFEIKERLLR